MCPACGTRTLTRLIDYDQFCGVAGPAAAVDLIPEISPMMLAARLARADDFDLIDVREPHEAAVARIECAQLIPLDTIPGVLNSLDRSRDIVVLCRSGTRSAYAVRQLQEAGFTRVSSLAGGMLRWSMDMGQDDETG